jgi:hypothetical protein
MQNVPVEMVPTMSSTGYLAIATLLITSIAGLVSQHIAAKKAEKAALMAAELFRLEAEQRRLDAAESRVALEEQARLVAIKATETASTIGRKIDIGRITQRQLIKQVEESKDLTKQGADAAAQAYHVANQVNLWRDQVNADIKKLAEAVDMIARRLEADEEKQT